LERFIAGNVRVLIERAGRGEDEEEGVKKEEEDMRTDEWGMYRTDRRSNEKRGRDQDTVTWNRTQHIIR